MPHQVTLSSAGNIWKVLVKPGDVVSKGDPLFIMEVMKMEVPHESPAAGEIESVHIEEGAEGMDEGALAVVIK